MLSIPQNEYVEFLLVSYSDLWTTESLSGSVKHLLRYSLQIKRIGTTAGLGIAILADNDAEVFALVIGEIQER